MNGKLTTLDLIFLFLILISTIELTLVYSTLINANAIGLFKVGDIVPEVTKPISFWLVVEKTLWSFLAIPLSNNSIPTSFLVGPSFKTF